MASGQKHKCSCGKEIEEKYKKCYDCFKKEKEKKEENDGFTDLNKTIQLPLWAAIGIFLAGAAIGAWLF